MNPNTLEGVELRLTRWMAAAAGLGILVFLFRGQPGMVCAFVVGAAISVLGYRWLAQAVKAALYAGDQGVPRRVVWNFILRYPIAFGAVLIFYETGWLPFMGVLIGLFVPFAAALMESLVLLGKMIRTEHYGA